MGITSKKENIKIKYHKIKTYIIVEEPLINVGILLEQPKITFSLLVPYQFNDTEIPAGDYIVEYTDGAILFNGTKHKEITFKTKHLHTHSFEIKDVIIGLHFHWERKEDQRFLGELKFIVENEAITAINTVMLEDYLTSVISSEMSATSSVQLLNTHAVISRSWMVSQLEQKHANQAEHVNYEMIDTPNEMFRWYDREDHAHFDVCADDHCQRYQGITRQSTQLVKQAIEVTRGEMVCYEGNVCDTRFSKCCGGIMETFENVWEPVPHPYLQDKPDILEELNGEEVKIKSAASFERGGSADRLKREEDKITSAASIDGGGGEEGLKTFPDLTDEEEAEKWIRTMPPAFCNTKDSNILRQVLNDYDQETTDFYRWKVTYTQEELSTLIKQRSGVDYGEILDLEPLERGTSGRIIKLKIVGTERVKTIGKELEIRRTLSPSHLYSSAFIVEVKDENDEGIPQTFNIIGAGWGHGVGLCQIGAAMMAEKGYHYNQILAHYFPNAQIEKKY